MPFTTKFYWSKKTRNLNSDLAQRANQQNIGNFWECTTLSVIYSSCTPLNCNPKELNLMYNHGANLTVNFIFLKSRHAHRQQDITIRRKIYFFTCTQISCEPYSGPKKVKLYYKHLTKTFYIFSRLEIEKSDFWYLKISHGVPTIK